MDEIFPKEELCTKEDKKMEKAIEHITCEDKELAYIIRADVHIEKTTFLTPPEFKQQVGFVVYPADGEVARHTHIPSERHLIGTSEVLIIRKGRCQVDIYNDDHKLVAIRELREGDLLLLINGGHGFRMLEDTIFLEIKQGPYIGLKEKERF